MYFSPVETVDLWGTLCAGARSVELPC